MRTFTAMFDSRSDAERARTELMRDGLVSAEAIELHDQSSSHATTDTHASHAAGERHDDANRDRGFWAGVKDFFLPDDDRHVYEEGMRRGGCVLTVSVGDHEADQVERLLEASDAVDVDAREAEWRGSGWDPRATASDDRYDAGGMSGTSMAGAGMAGSGLTGAGSTMGADDDRDARSTTDTSFGSSGRYESAGLDPTGDVGMGLGSGTRSEFGDARASSTETSIPVVEERLVVGKREVNRGGVRVRSYVREIPVSEQVTLRQEHVEVERRAVDQPLTGSAAITGQMGGRFDDEAFQERTVELVETSEEAVVGKQARIVEEVVIRKDVDQRVEEITDTVRRTDVDVERLADDRMGDDRPIDDRSGDGTTRRDV